MKKGVKKAVKFVLKGIVGFCVLFTVLILAIAYTPVSNMLAKRLIVPESFKRSDIIVVLGGGAYRSGVLGSSSNERLIRGMLLFKKGFAPKIIFTGSTITNPSRKLMHTAFASDITNDRKISEAEIMNDTARLLGIPDRDSMAESLSSNTYENVINAKAYMKRGGLNSCIVVTSATHMKRASLVVKKAGLDCGFAPVADYTPERTSALERLNLFHEVMWEYAGLALYRIHGYI